MVGFAERREWAVALGGTELMAWTRVEVESQIERNPRLGVALIRYFANECLSINCRIENKITYKTPGRTVLSLIELANSLGTPRDDGSMRIAHLTHVLLARYVGTSKEIVTSQMTRLRRLEMLRHDRRFTDVYTQAMQKMLREQGVAMPRVRVRSYSPDAATAQRISIPGQGGAGHLTLWAE